MAKGNPPVGRLKFKRADGAESEGTNRDGSTYTAMQVEVGPVWSRDGRLSVSLSPGFAITYNGKELPKGYLNLFMDDGANRGAGPSKPKRDADDDINF